MGYSLSIGEAEIEKDEEYGYIGFGVRSESHNEAPAYGEPTDNTNNRWPSYTSWHNFTDFVGLRELMYDEDEGFLKEHPGEVLLNSKHKEIIDQAMDKFKVKFPNVVAGYSPKNDGIDPEWPEENAMLVRLEWLKYWVDWSLANCENPIFRNT